MKSHPSGQTPGPLPTALLVVSLQISEMFSSKMVVLRKTKEVVSFFNDQEPDKLFFHSSAFARNRQRKKLLNLFQ